MWAFFSRRLRMWLFFALGAPVLSWLLGCAAAPAGRWPTGIRIARATDGRRGHRQRERAVPRQYARA
jgi:hypothetical protein